VKSSQFKFLTIKITVKTTQVKNNYCCQKYFKRRYCCKQGK